MNEISAQHEMPLLSGRDFIPLTDAIELFQCGGKAAALSRLIKLGMPVPPGFVVSNNIFRAFLSHEQLEARIASRLNSLKIDDRSELRLAAAEIRHWVETAPLPEGLEEALDKSAAVLLRAGRVIVRSSAIGEDSATASFAGQLDSFPDLDSCPGVAKALKSCWASYWSDRSLFYQLSRGVKLEGLGVLVQSQIEPLAAGVLFTEAPMPGNHQDCMMAEYVYGHGEQLVSGKVTPGCLFISRNATEWRWQAAPEQSDERQTELFQTNWPLELGRFGKILENERGVAQDIEWALDGAGKLWLVQSRPITKPVKHGEQPNNKNRAVVVWSNANINENFPDPVCPLLYSFAAKGYTHYFSGVARAFGISAKRLRSMQEPLDGIIGIHGARLYYNLTNIHAVMRMAPFGDELAEYFNHFVGAQQNPETEGERFSKPGRSRLAQFAELLTILLKTAWQYLFIQRRIAGFEARVDAYAENTRTELLASRNLAELNAGLKGFLDIRFHRWTDAALADAASMVCYGVLKRLLNNAFPSDEQSALHNSLLKGLPDLVSSRPVVELWNLSRKAVENTELSQLLLTLPADEALQEIRQNARYAGFCMALDRYLAEYGFRCSGELMLTVPSFQENPVTLLNILKTYLQLQGESPVEILESQNRERLAETARVFAQLYPHRLAWLIPWPTQAQSIRLFLYWTQEAVALRERARLKQALLYSRLRGIALAMGQKLVESDYLQTMEDVFFLTWQELEQLAAGQEMYPRLAAELVALRQKEHERLGKMILPEAFELEKGAYWDADKYAATPAANETRAVMKGIGACGGKAVAAASVLENVTQSDRLAEGSILVTRQTDPGWGPVFFLISGLVIERGGMLSHGAILAREFGIPAVVGVAGAVRNIPHGAKLLVDGDAGEIRLLD
jgi:pyruvate,water dikinase